jgi:FtsH ternary system domain X3
MRVRVEFRYNAETGEVELFQVDDIGRTTRIEDHDATHDDIAYAIGRVLDRRPGVAEAVPDREREPQPRLPAHTDAAAEEQHREPRRAHE